MAIKMGKEDCEALERKLEYLDEKSFMSKVW